MSGSTAEPARCPAFFVLGLTTGPTTRYLMLSAGRRRRDRMPSIKLIPLGGLGEIGMNCLAVEAGERILVVDCGIGFCDDHPTARVMHADFTWLIERVAQIDAIVITHGHEDHIGALPQLLSHARAPVYAPPYALDLIKARLDEHRGLKATLTPSGAGDVIVGKTMEVERFAVHHSIVDATGLIFRTPVGTIVHSGDFKIETNPAKGQHFDRARLEAVGREGVRLLLSDSTNVFVEGRAGDERDVATSLRPLIGSIPTRVVVSIFASNVFRLRTVIEIAKEAGRKVCLLGRSVRKHVEIAQAHGWLPDLSTTLVAVDQAAQLPRERLLVIATGTQGEPEAALARLAHGTQRHLELEPEDFVILSSRVIPGNEESVSAIVKRLVKRGIHVRDVGSDPGLHVSGHAAQDEQRALIELVRPQAFVPVHGTPAHLERHAALATEQGIAQTMVIGNGTVLEVTAHELLRSGSVATGRVYLEENGKTARPRPAAK